MFASKKSFTSLLAFFERDSRPGAIGNPPASSTTESQGARNATGQPWRLRAEMNSLRRRLNEMTTRAGHAEKELIAEKRERFYVQFERDEYEVRYERLRSMIGEAREAQNELQTRNASLGNRVHALESENEDLRAENNVMKVKAFRAHHEADMMGLVATQMGLQARSLDRQLKESNRSVKSLTERVEELEQSQWDTNTDRTSILDRENQGFGVEQEGLPHKGSSAMRAYGAANTGGTPDLGMYDRDKGEGVQGRDGVDGQAGLLRKLALRFQRGTPREDVHATTEVHWLGSKMFRKLRSTVRPGSDDAVELEGEQIEGRGGGGLHKCSKVLRAGGMAITSRKDLAMHGGGKGKWGEDENAARGRPGLWRKLTLWYQRSTVEGTHVTTRARRQVSKVLRELRNIAGPGSGTARGNEGD